jgi:DNA-binding GntR family transcriptional regulator
MIGDHHGRTAARATLLVKAVDGILGTHRPGQRSRDQPSAVGDKSDLLINTGGTPQPPASVVPGRYDNHEQIITALREGDQIRARDQMEAHIVGALALLHAEARTA